MERERGNIPGRASTALCAKPEFKEKKPPGRDVPEKVDRQRGHLKEYILQGALAAGIRPEKGQEICRGV